MVDAQIVQQTGGRRALTREIASRASDPSFIGGLFTLPNPDPILRKLGKSQEVYDAVAMDAHVLGELRSMRGALLSYEWRLQPGSEDPASLRAHELCEQVFARPPAPSTQWRDVIWEISTARLKGMSVHETVWRRDAGMLLPAALLDRPNRRFRYSQDNELRLLTKAQPLHGEPLAPRKWLVTRHMPSQTNPYGVALLSACFWPYTFKHGGFRFFYKFAEKYGLPWPVGKYPQGADQSKQEELLNNLARMVEDAVAVIPDDASVDLVSSSIRGDAVQEKLINLCNREMSKALTSQTLATEIQGEGSRAAAETHQARGALAAEPDRELVADSLSELCRWVTEINIPNAVPPTVEFYDDEEDRQGWAETIDTARKFLDVPVSFARERLQIPGPEDGEEVLPRAGVPAPPAPEFSRVACPNCGHHDYVSANPEPIDLLTAQAAAAADPLLAQEIDAIAALAADYERQGRSLADLRDALDERFPDIDDAALAAVTRDVLLVALLDGVDRADSS